MLSDEFPYERTNLNDIRMQIKQQEIKFQAGLDDRVKGFSTLVLNKIFIDHSSTDECLENAFVNQRRDFVVRGKKNKLQFT